MLIKLFSHRRWIAIAHDICIVPIAWFFAYWLRFNLDGIPEAALTVSIQLLPLIMIIQSIAYWNFGLYRGIWRFASIPDLIRIFQSVLVGVLGSTVVIYLITHFKDVPRSVFPIYGMLLIIGLGGSRFSVRWIKDRRISSHGKRVLIVGAGRAGEGIVRELLRDKDKDYTPIAFIDDKPNEKGQEIHGIRVMGRVSDIPSVAEKLKIDVIIIAVPSANTEQMRRILASCQETACSIQTLPGVNDIVSGRVSIDLLRQVSLEDLLGRDPVSLDWQAIHSAITNKVVLISGAGGSIGSELCRQVLRLEPKRLIAVERCEYNLFMLEQELSQKFPNIEIDKYLVDVNDKVAIDKILRQIKPEIIFHAAAYKHVPMLELQPREAVHNNVLGTANLAQLAVAHNVDSFVLVSTDKAVNPTNVMGATKRVSEMICNSLNNQGKTQFVTVRFGNVLGSAGSVVPIFKRQLEQGGPLTVTHPDITRFFMTIPEACQLILQAHAIGNGSEIYVLDMGEPVKIQFLAEQIIRLSGKKLGENIEIRYTGLRPGEKLYEELFHTNEALMPTTHEKIFQARSREYQWSWLEQYLEILEVSCQLYDNDKIRTALQELVPEFESQTLAVES